MTKPTSQANIYLDLLIVETLSDHRGLSKFSQDASGNLMGGVVDKIKGYVSNNIDPNDRAGSVLNMIAPGLITTTLSAIGLGGIWSWLIGLAVRVFHIDIAGILRSIWGSLKSALGGGKQVSSDQVHNIVQSAVQEHSANPPTATQSETGTPPPDQTPADDANLTVAQQLRRAQLLSLSLVSKSGMLKTSAPSRSYHVSLLSQILSFVFRVILSAAGLMVAGDVMNHFLGRPSAIDTPIRGGKPVSDATTTLTSQPSRFPLNPAYQDVVKNSSSLTWTEDVPNNDSSIQQMLLDFSKQVYTGMDKQETNIQSSPYFHNLVEVISWYNHEHPGGPVVFIPRVFTTMKQLVDSFVQHLPTNNAA